MLVAGCRWLEGATDTCNLTFVYFVGRILSSFGRFWEPWDTLFMTCWALGAVWGPWDPIWHLTVTTCAKRDQTGVPKGTLFGDIFDNIAYLLEAWFEGIF